jgi:hypothetical protein
MVPEAFVAVGTLVAQRPPVRIRTRGTTATLFSGRTPFFPAEADQIDVDRQE